jgi:hypothetical protein
MELHHRPPFPLCILAANLLLWAYKRRRDLPRASPRSLPTPTLLLHARVATFAPRHWATTAIPPSTAAVGENRSDTSLFLLHYDEFREPGAPCSVCLCGHCHGHCPWSTMDQRCCCGPRAIDMVREIFHTKTIPEIQ